MTSLPADNFGLVDARPLVTWHSPDVSSSTRATVCGHCDYDAEAPISTRRRPRLVVNGRSSADRTLRQPSRTLLSSMMKYATPCSGHDG